MNTNTNTTAGWGASLLTVENAKTVKGEALGYLTGILYLAPSDESVASGGKNTCPMASRGCAAACLFSAGRGKFDSVRAARIAKTVAFFKDRDGFLEDLRASISAVVRKASREGLTPAIRLNGTSDIAWERLTRIMEEFPVQFYDYTKIPKRAKEFAAGAMPPNYHLTFSRSEENQADVAEIVSDTSCNVAVVFEGGLPTTWLGREVVNGDEHDLRFLDKRGVIVGLKAKGAAKGDASGFTVRAS